ncbi:Lipocalin-like domain-containing protein [Phaeosphaeria sp. MPI-PUGE-AT-0046c]|nr:Lipocalin-like domain-containing protein [Phaeosphaeria sp. MPI-PUGE-AT-0046c]
MAPLSTTIIGTYSLISYFYHPVADYSQKTYPHGANATGQITYHPSGYMSALLIRPGQAPFSDGAGMLPDTSGTPSDWEAVGRNIVAYAGRFWIKEAEQTVVHEMANIFIPSMKGVHAPRKVAFEENGSKMVLSVEKVEIGGVESRIEVVWRRAEQNDISVYPGV